MQLYKLSKVSGQTPLYTPVDNPQALLKCACKDCPAVCQCACHTLSHLVQDKKYLARLREHGGFFVVGALWSAVIVFFWPLLGGAIDLALAVGLLLFFWVCDLVRFFDDRRFPRLAAALKPRMKKR